MRRNEAAAKTLDVSHLESRPCARACDGAFAAPVDRDRRRRTALSAFIITHNRPQSFPLFSPRVDVHCIFD